MREILLITALVCLAVAIAFALVRAIKGPRVADRIMGINMIGTLTVAAIAILAVLLDEAWLLDVSIIYGLLSFLAVVVLSKVSIASHEKESEKEAEKNA